MRTSYRLLSERSQVRLLPGARSTGTTVHPSGTASVANTSAKRLRNAYTSTLRCLAALVIGFTLLNLVLQQGAEGFEHPAPVSLVSTLMADNGCWAGEAPEGVTIPGHVVVTRDGVTQVGGPRLVGKALEQVFDGADHGLIVHGFCR